jgi:hypothetical protein
MTRVLDSLEIFETKPPAEWVGGQFDYTTILEGFNAHKSFLIQIAEGLSDDNLFSTVCHELEHYDVAHVSLTLKLITEEHLGHAYDASKNVIRGRFPEQAHSNPSYFKE